MARNPAKVANFAPELLELFKKAYRERVEIQLKSIGEANRLRQRLHQLRTSMRNEDHPLLQVAEGVSVEAPKGNKLVVKPADNQFIASIKDALGDTSDDELDIGVQGNVYEDKVPPDKIDVKEQTQTTTADAMSAFLKGTSK